MSKIFLGCCLILALNSPALAIESDVYPYVGAVVGSNLTAVTKLSDASGSIKTDFSPGPMAGLTAGVAFNSYLDWKIERIRVEAELGYRSSNLSKMKNSQGQSVNMSAAMTVKNIMLNGYVENTDVIMFDVPVNLFLTAGAGFATAAIGTITYQDTPLVEASNDTQFAYQGGFGIGNDVTKNIALEATYKYMGTTPFYFGGIKAVYGGHNVMVGARYSFK